MASQSAVLLPVRLETRFDETEADGKRLRVLVVPDGCWFDRHQPASDAELRLLARALAAAGGSLVTGAEATPEAAAAFDALARQVGPGRALWLARSGTEGPQEGARTGARGTRIHGLPAEIHLYADLLDPATGEEQRAVLLDRTTVHRQAFTISPSEDEADGWWPSWNDMEAAGLTLSMSLDAHSAGPIDPDSILALYVVGLGDEPAEAVLRPHLDAGDMGLLQPGTPTNTVTGAPAADLGRDPAAWRTLGERSASPEERRVSRALTGQDEAFGPLLGSSDGLADAIAAALIPALWPALVGTAMIDTWVPWRPPGQPPDPTAGPDTTTKDLWRLTGRIRDWARSHLRPDGPLPILRLGDQPYGLWPVSDWGNWSTPESEPPGSDDPPEDQVVEAASALLASVAERARTGLGTVVGADEQRLWELLAQTPTSNAYEVRGAMHIRLLMNLPLDDQQRDALMNWWKEVISVMAGAMGMDTSGGSSLPSDDHVMTVGAPVPLALRLVLPDVAFDGQGQPLFLPGWRADIGEAEAALTEAPGRWVAAACAEFLELFDESGLNPDRWGQMTDPIEWWPPSLLWRLLIVSGMVALDQALRESLEPVDYHPEQVLAKRVQSGIPMDAGGPAVDGYRRFLQGLERLARVCESGDQSRLPAELDRVVRGLLDTATLRIDPWLTGAAWQRLAELDEGPRPVGLYGWVDRPHTGDPGPDVETSVLLSPSDRQARTAVVLRDKGRSDPDGRWHLDLTSATVRDAARLADDVRTGAHPAEALGREVERLIGDRRKVDLLRAAFRLRKEHAGRRTCDGLKVLDAAMADPLDSRLSDAGLDSEDIDRIRDLRTTTDAYADLLVADGVQHALAGRAEAARQSMEAAAGLGMPPPLDVLATPRSGRSLRSTVLAHLPAASSPPDERSPAAIASPAFASWLVAATGRPDGPEWTWMVTLAPTDSRVGPNGSAVVPVNLLDMGLVPADALAIHSAVLDALALETAGPSVAGAEVVSPSGPEVARRLAATLATRAPSGADLGLEPADAAAQDASYRQELVARLDRLRNAATELIARLDDAVTDSERESALRETTRWGMLPAVEADDLTGDTADAADELRRRLERVPATDPGIEVTDLARIVAELGLPDGAIPMLLSTSGESLGAATGGLDVEPTDPGGRPQLDRTWLELIAAVRPPLARVEAHQALTAATGEPVLVAASNHRGNPWLLGLPPSRPREEDPRLVVTYGPEPPPPVGPLAIGIIDTWAEVIPDEQHTASAAFRFNAPGSRAPQALLLAVTPVIGKELTPEVVQAIVAGARRCAHARMARREDLANLDLLGWGILPAFEEGGFQRSSRATWNDWP